MVMKVPVRPTPALHVYVNTHKSSKMARVLSVIHAMHTIMNINKEDLKMWRFNLKQKVHPLWDLCTVSVYHLLKLLIDYPEYYHNE